MSDSVALLSDVHGNAEAFSAVLEDIRDQGIKTIINLGDVIGYGPEPEKCLEMAIAHCTYVLCGNHEYAVMNTAEGFNPVAKGAVDFVRERLKPDPDSDIETTRRWEFLQRLPRLYENGTFMAMHGSPRHPVMEYVLPSDPEVDPLKLDEVFISMKKQIAFVGHTHFPGIVEEDGSVFLTVPSLQGAYEVPKDRKVVVNVGSVGQPRDRDVRSCYVEYDGAQIFFRRVEYNIESTVKKIHDSGRLHESLGHRLLEGR